MSKVYKEILKSGREQFPDGSEEEGKRRPPETISLEEAKALLGDPNLVPRDGSVLARLFRSQLSE